MSPANKTDDLDEAVQAVNESIKTTAPELDGSAVEKLPEENIDTESPVNDELIEEVIDSEADEAEGAEPKAAESDEDAVLDQAVDDIEKQDSDKLLQREDEERELDAAMAEAETKGFKAWARSLWSNQRWRWTIIICSTLLILAAALVPNSRYFILNNVGVRSSLSLKVIDGGTLQPLKNVRVQAGGSSGQTGSDGVVRLEKVRLGRTKLQIEKRAFSVIERPITVGWGSNPLDEFKLEAAGTQYTFVVKDFLSGKPILGAEASALGDGNASSDDEGKLVLTLDTAEIEDTAEVSVDISASNYRSETMTFVVSNREEQEVNLVPARKHLFVSKRSGTYDVYAAHVDGKNEAKLVSGTGLERDDISLVPHQSKEIAALVATRENVHNQHGFLLSTLYLLNSQSGELIKLDQSEQIQVVGWSDDGRLIYVKIVAGASGSDPHRHRLMSFNFDDQKTSELAASNSFNDVVMADGRIYYAPSNIFNESAAPGVFVIDPSGANQRMIMDREGYSIVRSNFEKLSLNTAGGWFDYTIGSAENAKVAIAPGNQNSRIYMDNPSNNFSLWSDNRDGKGVLLNYDTSTKSDNLLLSRSGLRPPYYWLNDKYVIVRVNDGKETADYVLNTEGGEARKITDVTNTSGVGRWFYY